MTTSTSTDELTNVIIEVGVSKATSAILAEHLLDGWHPFAGTLHEPAKYAAGEELDRETRTMVAEAARAWLVEHEAGVFAGARERAYARPGYVDVDAAILALGRLEGYAGREVREDRDLERVVEESPAPDRHGIVRRLLAAFGSAASRGDVRYTATPLGQPESDENGVAVQTSRRIRVTVESSGGVWSSRAYRMQTVITVCQDNYGVTGWHAGRGIARVTGRTSDEVTLFGGHAVGRMIAALWMGDGLARRQISAWVAEPWRDKAIAGLASLAAAAVRGEGKAALALCRYLADTRACPDSDQRLLAAALNGLGVSREARGAWKANPGDDLGVVVADDDPDDWRQLLGVVIEDLAEDAIDPGRKTRVRAQNGAKRAEYHAIARRLIVTGGLIHLDAFQEWDPDLSTGEPVMTYATDGEVVEATRIIEGVGWTVERRERPDLGENGCVALCAVPPAGWDAEWPEATGDEGPLAVLPLGPLL